MKKPHLVMVAIISLTASQSAAQLTGNIVLQNIGDNMIVGYLSGLSQAYTFANVQNTINGQREIYCLPDNVAFDASLAEAALRTAVNDYGGDQHPAWLVLAGMRKMFPC